jgi:hypothetical protein
LKRSTFHSASLIRVNGGGRSHLCLLQPQGHLEGEINHDCDHSSQKAFDVTLSTVAIIRSAFDAIILRCQGVSEACSINLLVAVAAAWAEEEEEEEEEEQRRRGRST